MYFVLNRAARYVRGQSDQHMSMLVHTTVYTTRITVGRGDPALAELRWQKIEGAAIRRR